MVMSRCNIAAHSFPHIFGQQPVDFVVGVMGPDAMITIRKVVRLVTVVAGQCESIHQHQRVLNMHVIYSKIRMKDG